jgi:pimeloyl-ACP methyl ester carboxylesterase
MTRTVPGERRGFAHTRHGNIEYRERGSGPTLIMLHNTPYSSARYSTLMPALEDALHCVAISTPGYGESDRPPTPYETVEEFASAFTWVFDDLGIERAHLYGGQTGSQVAMSIAADYPERVDRLVLEEPFHWGTPSRREAHLRRHRYYPPRPDGGHLVDIWKRRGGDRPGTDLKKLSAMMFDYLNVNDDEGVEELYGGMGWEGAGPNAMTKWDTWEQVQRIQAPTLVMHGTGSELGRSHEKFLELIPNARGCRPPPGSAGDSSIAPQLWDPNADLELWASEVKRFLLEE